MKTLVIITLLTLIFIGCDNSATSQTSNANQVDNTKDSILIFKSALESFKKIGFVINPQIDEKDLINRWKEILKFNYTNPEAVYITLGGFKGYNPEVFYSDNCWHFDVEAIEGQGSYKRIFDNIKRISKGDINFQNVKDYCNDNEDDKAWVSFTLNGDKYKWDLKVEDDYVDIKLFDKLQVLFTKYNKKGRLTYFSEGQSCVFSYFTKEEFDKFNDESGMKIAWLQPSE
jgi:hypothetical protein